MDHFIKQNGKLLITAVCFCVLWIVFSWIRTNKHLQADKNATIAVAIQRNSNLAVALEQYAIRTINNADAVLQLVKREYERVGYKINLPQLLDSNTSDKDLFVSVSIADEKGTIIIANISRPPGQVINVQDKDHFNYHLLYPDSGLYIGKPILSPITGTVIIPLSRRINKTNGDFGGIVSVQIEPAAFTSFYANANLRPNDIISLIAPDGTTYARRTGSKESYGENISKSPLFQHISKAPVSNYFARDAIRGIPTYFSYRQLKQYPIIATVGSAQDDVLANHYKTVSKDRLFTIAIDLLILLIAGTICYILAEQKRYQRELTRQVILAQEREREEIGRELHDNINQVLGSVRLYLDIALNNKEAAPELIPKSMKHLSDCINDIRNLSHSLSAPTLGGKSLVDAIRSLAEMVSSSSGLHIVFQHDTYTRLLPMDQKLAIYRIVQEQLNNVIKHAHATEVLITLSQKEDQTYLTLHDNGRGFNAPVKKNGIGLNNIISRAKIFKGRVTIESAPGKGCLLKVNIPMW